MARLQARIGASRAERLAGPAQGELPRQRSRGVALVLALLFGGLGLHLFYLGYYGRGTLYLVLTLVGVLLFSLAAIALVVAVAGGSTSGLVGLLVAGALLTGVAGVLAIIDAVRILTGDLKPKNGEYRSRFF
ncbi:NINE protein [Hymenobacter caeli]|uniref:TM2 domain-containing membrane protein YozV n=1 Tax=Hymenobacter caeli TaxID=2735894 RepID=A0ABX2FT22_9BACT|nr:NINE protein [Hymenobacter caeli]NRT20352.1 TM2 domain-containing membrane protein YozV [Hymenobacter caeli]